MNPFAMALRSLRERWVSSTLTALSVALGVALVVAVLVLEREARTSFQGTAHGVEILVGGTKGGRIDTLLSALYHVGRAPGRVPWSFYEMLRAHADVEYAVPLAFGDRYRGFPVVGTTEEIFTRFRPRPGVAFEVEGETFSGGARRAVVGAEAARSTGLRVGDTFAPSHTGLENDPRHRDELFTVAGVARATGTAHDRAIWVDIADFLALRGHEGLLRDGGEEAGVSAILVKTASAYPWVVEDLIRRINDGDEAQAIRPLQVVSELFALVGTVQRMLQWVAVLVVVVAAAGATVTLYHAMAERRRDVALLRALGAGRPHIVGVVLLESVLLCGGGALLGLLLGHGGAALAAPVLEARAGVRLDAWTFLPEEPFLLIALLAVGALSGIAPALRAYRVDVAAQVAR